MGSRVRPKTVHQVKVTIRGIKPPVWRRLLVPSDVTLARFLYRYDFGDDWEHDVLVEDVVDREARSVYPRCVAGRRACPPEDVGGSWGYNEFLAAIADPTHDEHDSYREWSGDDFDPERCDLTEINARMSPVLR